LADTGRVDESFLASAIHATHRWLEPHAPCTMQLAKLTVLIRLQPIAASRHRFRILTSKLRLGARRNALQLPMRTSLPRFSAYRVNEGVNRATVVRKPVPEKISLL
jgi:hypothetical protein